MAKILMGLVPTAQVTVATAGTPVPLSATPLEVTNVTVQWDDSNAGDVYIGDSGVTSTQCLKLNAANPTATVSVDEAASDEDRIVIDLSQIYVDAATSGDKVFVAYVAIQAKDYNA